MIRILGVMTGTSVDGLDGACIEMDAEHWTLLWDFSAAYPSALRERVLEVQKPGSRHSMQDLLELDRDLGDWYGRTLAREISRKEPVTRPHVIANHGQTVAHFPRKAGGTTAQLGNPAWIASRTGLTVISHFRDGDMAVRGQGAPLAPLFHGMLARRMGAQGIAIHNIGGISNLTYIPPSGDPIAFDTGPGNIWIDAAAAASTRRRLKMDRGGKLAAQGEPDARLLEKLLKHPFFKQRPPKSTGRDDFPISDLLKSTRQRGPDLVATATELTIETIARAYERWVLPLGSLQKILVCGGGAKNPFLMKRLSERLHPIQVTTLESEGIDPSLVEAQAFAVFGYLSLLGKPLGGSWTGVGGFGPPGWITPGANWAAVLAALRGSLA
jgi:anhydro-N-acetylmuramic acid kinase